MVLFEQIACQFALFCYKYLIRGYLVMRYLVVALLGLISGFSHAQVAEYERKVTCGSVKVILKALTGKDAEEVPLWVGRTDDTNTQTAVLVNRQTLAWTVIQYDTKVACVLSSGEGYRYRAEPTN